MNHILEVDGIQLDFNLKQILTDIYIKCETGKITGLLGRNGEGKTCLMNVVYGKLEASSKSVRFDNTSIIHPFQYPDKILYLPPFNFIPKFLSLKQLFIDYDLEFSEFDSLFPEFASRYITRIGKLSGGERRLIEVYLIVKSKTQFCFLDEPFSHLMPLQIEKVMKLLKEEKQEKGFLITDHMYQHIINLSDNLYVLKAGKTHLTKEPADIEKLGYARL